MQLQQTISTTPIEKDEKRCTSGDADRFLAMGNAMGNAQTSANNQSTPEADPGSNILTRIHMRSSLCGFHSGGASEAGSDSY